MVRDQPRVAHDMGKRVTQRYSLFRLRQVPIRLIGSQSNPDFGSLPQLFFSSESFFWVVIDSIPHEEVGSPGQFMG